MKGGTMVRNNGGIQEVGPSEAVKVQGGGIGAFLAEIGGLIVKGFRLLASIDPHCTDGSHRHPPL
jgi:hypothetical protein